VTLREGLIAAWITGALALLGYFAIGVLKVRRIVRTAEPLEDSSWTALLAETADRLDLAGLPKLVASDRTFVPFAFGAWRTTIVLPAWAEEWSDERRRLVLAHELAHVKRHDFPGHALARVTCALYWCHPLVWLAARRLRAESERACDDVVLGSGARASDYADHLLDILSSVRHEGLPAAALAMARRREFEGRLLAILDPALKRGGLRRTRSIVILSGLAALFFVVATSAPTIATQSAEGTAPQADISSQAAEVSTDDVSPDSPPARQAGPRAQKPQSSQRANEKNSQEDQGTDAVEHDQDGDERPHGIPADKRATLIRVLRDDPEASVRRSAAWALAESREADAITALGGSLRGDADGEVREMAAWALGQATPTASATAPLAEALKKDSSSEVRATAAWALGQRRIGDASSLVAAIGDASPDVREVAIWALGNQGMEKAPEALVAALRDSEADVRVVSAWALSQIRDSASVGALQTAFKEEKSDEVRRSLFHALVLVGANSAEVVEWAFSSKDAELRAAAVRMLAGHGFGAWPWPWPRPEPRPLP
jgi:beta-lactamase regulating signal transducer with metallopeptidase domain